MAERQTRYHCLWRAILKHTLFPTPAHPSKAETLLTTFPQLLGGICLVFLIITLYFIVCGYSSPHLDYELRTARVSTLFTA